MLNFLATGLGAIAGAVGSYFQHKREVIQAKREVELAQINAKAKIANQVHDINLANIDADTAQIQENQKTYFDELVKLVVFLFPFYALIDPIKFSEFCKVLGNMPLELKLAWMTVVITTLAGRGMFSPLTNFFKRK